MHAPTPTPETPPEASDAKPDKPRPSMRLYFGVVLLAVLVAVVLNRSEGQEFAKLAQRVEPRWLLLSVILQAATYLAQGEVWRAVGRAVRVSISVWTSFGLSLVKLFVDQAIPSAGISGSVVLARALEEHGMPRAAVGAAVIVNTVSYHIAYVVALGAALLIAALHGQANALLLWVSVAFLLLVGPVTVGILMLSGRPPGRTTRRLSRVRALKGALEFLKDADPAIARRHSLIWGSTLLQALIVIMDVATIWVLLRSLGVVASWLGVFASFMISNLFRTMGVIPGGIGTFEAASVLTLKMAGVGVPAALSATLLFRGLSFWLPMLPGLWLWRHPGPVGQNKDALPAGEPPRS